MNFLQTNLIANTDSYKFSHANQFPVGTNAVSYYIEARKEHKEIMVAGLMLLSKRIVESAKLITHEMVDEENAFVRSHFGRDMLDLAMWRKIADTKAIPISIHGLPEGSVYPTKLPIARIDVSDPLFVPIVGFMETMILRDVWFASTVATISHECVKICRSFLTRTADFDTEEQMEQALSFMVHDFGARGTSSNESAAIGGMSHLYNSAGTDTFISLKLVSQLFGIDTAVGFSIPAREHSTTICYGDNGLLSDAQEDEAYMNSINQYGEGIYAMVMDSVDFKKSVKRVCDTMKAKIIEKGGKCVFRPDSGDMFDNIVYLLNVLGDTFGYTVNSKGFKVLHPSVGVIQGDGIDKPETIAQLLNFIELRGWGAQNVAFGMGGGLLQKFDRDTYSFVMKMSAIRVSDKWRRVCKNPKDAAWKKSKSGILETHRNSQTGDIGYFDYLDDNENCDLSLLNPNSFYNNRLPVFIPYLVDGKLTHKYNRSDFEQIRNRAKQAKK